jgi:hypothetical protein
MSRAAMGPGCVVDRLHLWRGVRRRLVVVRENVAARHHKAYVSDGLAIRRTTWRGGSDHLAGHGSITLTGDAVPGLGCVDE